MGFCNAGTQTVKTAVDGLSLHLLHQAQCTVCPLNHQTRLKTPHMQPSGSDKPVVYMLGEAPGAEEDARGEPFIGRAGQTLRHQIPRGWLPSIRFGNVVRTRPPDNRTPTPIEIECCRPSVTADIEQTKPKAIFGFGGVPLKWAIEGVKISNWMGRHVPIKVGNHTCWFFPMYHPSYINRSEKEQHGHEIRFAWERHLKGAFDLTEKLPDPVVHDTAWALNAITYVTGNPGDAAGVIKRLDEFAQEEVVGIDYETSHLRPYSKGAKILSVAISGQDYTFAFPLYHSKALWSKEDRNIVDSAWYEFLYKAKARKVAHHLGFEMEWSGYFYGKECLRAGRWGCSESQAYILDSRRGSHSLDFLCLQHFGIHLKQISNVNVLKLNDTALDVVLPYNGLDAKYCRWLYLRQRKALKATNQASVYQQQLRRIPTAVLTQMKGVPVHQPTVNKFHTLYSQRLDKIEEEIDQSDVGRAFYKQTGHNYRPSALRDVSVMLKDILKLSVEGADEAVLQGVKHKIARQTINWRKTNKLLSTYVKPVMQGSTHLCSDGKLRPTINLCATSTWRTSEEDPNLQNWPKRQTRDVRSQICPGGDYRIVSFDYGQIQARNVAMESKDQTLVKAFWDRYDIHTDWMQRIYKAYPKWINGEKLSDKDTQKKYRHMSKNGLVFPLFFGAHEKKLSIVLKVPVNICADLRADFLAMFPGVAAWHKDLAKFYHQYGYVTGLSGFRRHAPCEPNEMINSPIQGDEALIVCDAWARLSERDPDRLQAVMEIHDDLTFVMLKKDVDKLSEIIIGEMLHIAFPWINVPLLVEMSIGEDWQNMKRVGEFESVGLTNEWREVKNDT